MPERMVCLNCIDGRVQIPVIEWIKSEHGAENVDMITEPGMDGLLDDQANPIDAIVDKLKTSIEVNKAAAIFVVGHHDCRGNPVSDEQHMAHVQSAVFRLKQTFPDMAIVGLWVDPTWSVNPL